MASGAHIDKARVMCIDSRRRMERVWSSPSLSKGPNRNNSSSRWIRVLLILSIASVLLLIEMYFTTKDMRLCLMSIGLVGTDTTNTITTMMKIEKKTRTMTTTRNVQAEEKGNRTDDLLVVDSAPEEKVNSTDIQSDNDEASDKGIINIRETNIEDINTKEAEDTVESNDRNTSYGQRDGTIETNKTMKTAQAEQESIRENKSTRLEEATNDEQLPVQTEKLDTEYRANKTMEDLENVLDDNRMKEYTSALLPDGEKSSANGNDSALEITDRQDKSTDQHGDRDGRGAKEGKMKQEPPKVNARTLKVKEMKNVTREPVHEPKSNASTKASSKKPAQQKTKDELNAYPLWWVPKTAKVCPHKLLNGTNITNVTVFVSTWWDRSGAVIARMIMAKAYAYRYGYTFGGSIPRVRDSRWPRRKQVHEDLIDVIGLGDELKFVMPIENSTNEFDLDWPNCLKNRTDITQSFVEYLRSKQRLPRLPATEDQIKEDSKDDRDRKQSVVVHVRRGDAQPCTRDIFRQRYSPNSFYQRALDTYAAEDARVTIFSESDSFENWDEFRRRGYQLKLDESIAEAWRAMMTSDVLITSPGSYFSFVPAILNPGKIYSTTKEYDNWEIIDPTIKNESDKVLTQKMRDHCRDWIKKNPKHRARHTYW